MQPTHQDVNTSSTGLIKATLGAALLAGAVLTFAWLPAEYGIDPTGVGKMLGLTEMGDIKAQLSADAIADTNTATTSTTGSAESIAEINQKLDDIQTQLTAITVSIASSSAAPNIQANLLPSTQPALQTQTQTQTEAQAQAQAQSQPITSPQPTDWRDEVNYSLAPTEGIEVKLAMTNAAIAEFEWSANGAVLNHDTHGDGDGQSISYEKGRSVPGQSGELTAAFTGNHGWFWRNRTDNDVVVTLRTRGDYKEMVLPKSKAKAVRPKSRIERMSR